MLRNLQNSLIRATNLGIEKPKQKLMAIKFNNCDDEDSEGSDEDIDANDVTTLTVENQSSIHLPINLATFLPKLQSISIRQSKLIAIGKDELNGFSDLKEIAITDNNLATLPSDAFANTPNLLTIDISSNKLTELPAGIFSSLINLQFINASSNALNELKDDIFGQQNNITELIFTNNKLTNIAPKFFRYLKNLQTIDFKGSSCINRKVPDDINLISLRAEIIDHC